MKNALKPSEEWNIPLLPPVLLSAPFLSQSEVWLPRRAPWEEGKDQEARGSDLSSHRQPPGAPSVAVPVCVGLERSVAVAPATVWSWLASVLFARGEAMALFSGSESQAH